MASACCTINRSTSTPDLNIATDHLSPPISDPMSWWIESNAADAEHHVTDDPM
jgi:hypothetical protein